MSAPPTPTPSAPSLAGSVDRAGTASTPLRCSDGSEAVQEQLVGTAPYALGWVALEQTGPWGARAFTQSHLDPAVGSAIEDGAAAHDVRPALIRGPGRHADDPTTSADRPRTVLVASTHPGRTWLLEGSVRDPADLLRLDWPALRRGDVGAVRRSLPTLEPSSRAHLLVCTNAKRDVCCAVKGRPVALGAAAEHPGQVWEVTHTSGHRFAPTTVLLPPGTLHGRVDVARAGELLRAAARGATVLDGSRGRSTWPPAAQVAELAVREQHTVLSLDALTVRTHEALDSDTWSTELEHVDGRAWRVVTTRADVGAERAESCGKALKPLTFTAASVTPRP